MMEARRPAAKTEAVVLLRRCSYCAPTKKLRISRACFCFFSSDDTCIKTRLAHRRSCAEDCCQLYATSSVCLPGKQHQGPANVHRRLVHVVPSIVRISVRACYWGFSMIAMLAVFSFVLGLGILFRRLKKQERRKERLYMKCYASNYFELNKSPW